MAESRSPWRGAPNLNLESFEYIAADLVYEKAEKLGIPQLRLLPPELIQMVQDCSPSGLFWRLSAVQAISRELSAIPPSSSALATSALLRDISSLVRGQEPDFVQATNLLPFLRLTIDDRGVRRIESLPRRPSYKQQHAVHLAFAILDRGQLEQTTVHIKVVVFFHWACHKA